MGGRQWLRLQEWQILLLFFLQICPMLSAAVDTDGELFCKQKESEVQTIAEKAVENAGRLCELIDSCTERNCSRVTCFSPSSDVKSYECMNLAPNTNITCGCLSVRANYGRSHVRVPYLTGNLNSLKTEVSMSICSQRALDTTFKSIPRSATFYSYYLGTADGAFRYYPGVEDEGTCGSYDPRIRAWYTGATSVIKDLVVLVDVSSTMGTEFGYVDKTTPLQSALNMTQLLLNTLSGGDRATVILYSTDSSNIGSFHVQGASLNTSDSRFNQLLEEVGNTTIRDDVEYSNITAGISGAVSALGSNSPDGALKVIVVFTDGKSTVPPGELNALAFELNTHAVSLFIYQMNGMDPGLTQLACSVVPGHNEGLTINPLLNPLYALKSYFNFFALNRQPADPDNLAFWQEPYPDYGVLGKVITVAYPAISPAGDLVGVAGMDVQVDGITQNLWSEIETALKTRRTRPPRAIAKAVMNSPCDIGINDGPTSCSPRNAVPVCPMAGKHYSYKQVLCCAGCGGLDYKATNKLKILWICLGVAGASALVSGVVWLLMRLGRPVLRIPPPAILARIVPAKDASL